jgi:uncharacterized membrane protein (UPF0127 family)
MTLASRRGANKLAPMRLLYALVAVLGFFASAQAAEITGPQPTLPQTSLVIDTAKGPVRFTVEMATTWPQQETGMMFRKSVAPNAGMLFVFDQASEQAFWMKNTLIALDIVFIKADGKIARIAANAKPLSLDDIPSYEPVKAVLEIGGGRAAQLGLKPGDVVHNAAFGNMGKAAAR